MLVPALAHDPFHAGDHWRGTYTCPQGSTALDLVIVSVDGSDITDALFDYDWNGVTGSFHLSGTFDAESGHATFLDGAWISRPSSEWYSVGLDGTATESSYAGLIVGKGCGSFSLTRIRS